MRYCQEKGIVCQYAGTNMHCRLTACVFPKESLYPTASGGGHLMKCESCTKYDDCRTGSGLTWPCGAYRPNTGGGMDIEKLVEDLHNLLKQYGEKIPYGELVGAPWPYSRAGDLVWQDPEPYFIEQAATALSTLQAENEQLRAELEQAREKNAGLALALLTECAPNPDCLGDDEWRAIRAELERVKAERDAAVDCIYQIEDALNRGSDNDWAREYIAKWESQKED